MSFGVKFVCPPCLISGLLPPRRDAHTQELTCSLWLHSGPSACWIIHSAPAAALLQDPVSLGLLCGAPETAADPRSTAAGV